MGVEDFKKISDADRDKRINRMLENGMVVTPEWIKVFREMEKCFRVNGVLRSIVVEELGDHFVDSHVIYDTVTRCVVKITGLRLREYSYFWEQARAMREQMNGKSP